MLTTISAKLIMCLSTAPRSVHAPPSPYSQRRHDFTGHLLRHHRRAKAHWPESEILLGRARLGGGGELLRQHPDLLFGNPRQCGKALADQLRRLDLRRRRLRAADIDGGGCDLSLSGTARSTVV